MKRQNNIYVMCREAARTVLPVTELSTEMNKQEGLNLHPTPIAVISLTEALIHEVLSRELAKLILKMHPVLAAGVLQAGARGGARGHFLEVCAASSCPGCGSWVLGGDG